MLRPISTYRKSGVTQLRMTLLNALISFLTIACSMVRFIDSIWERRSAEAETASDIASAKANCFMSTIIEVSSVTELKCDAGLRLREWLGHETYADGWAD